MVNYITPVPMRTIQSKSRKEPINLARQALCLRLKFDGYSEREIAKEVNRDRSTIYHLIKRFEDLLYIKDQKAITAYINTQKA